MSITEEKKKKRKSKELVSEEMQESPNKKKSKSWVEDAIENCDIDKKKKRKSKDKAEDGSNTEAEVISPKKKKKRDSMNSQQKENGVSVSGADWSCAGCGKANPVFRRICAGCSQLNSKTDTSGDWMCPKASCGISNFSTRTTCRVCTTYKDGSGCEVAGEDWTCSKCQFSNYGARRNCKQCNNSNSAIKSVGGDADWSCSCGFLNFASRLKCKQCDKQKAGAAPAAGGDKPRGADWSCGGCGFLNFASRAKCMQCNQPNATAQVSAGASEPQEGDWLCECGFSNFRTRHKCRMCETVNPQSTNWDCKCGFSNYADRFQCKSCGEKHPEGGGGQGKAGASTLTQEGDWSCSECGFNNFKSRSQCKQCNSTNTDTTNWQCVSCSFSNFCSRYKCKQCGQPQPEDGDNKPLPEEASGDSDWLCSGCSFSNFASRVRCKKCDKRKEGGAPDVSGGREDNWECKCGFSNYSTRSHCKSCAERKSESILEHRIGMSHLSFECTEAEISQFFSPLSPMNVVILTDREGNPMGKANAYFTTHEECLQAMDKDQLDLGTWRVNLYLNSTDGTGVEHKTTPKKEASGNTNRGDNWDCNCGYSNFAKHKLCVSCGTNKSASVIEHRIGMSHLSYECTEDDIKQFFSPLEAESMRLLTDRDGNPMGKANVYFKTHEDCLQAMEKNQQDINNWRVNLYLNSTEETTTPHKSIQQNKIVFDEPGLDETAEASSDKKKFKWDKMIRSILSSSESSVMSSQQLRRALMPLYTHVTGEECSKKEFKRKLEEKLTRSHKFTYQGGVVALS